MLPLCILAIENESDRLMFNFESDAGVLSGLNGRAFQVKDVPFVREYFPDVIIPDVNEEG